MFTVAALFALCAFPISPRVRNAAQVLRVTRVAMGAAGRPESGTLHVTGRKTRAGLIGRYREIDDLRTGLFRRDVAYESFENAEGADASGRWRLDASGAVHALDSPEADAVAKTERYLARRGYLFDEAGVNARLLSSEADSSDVAIEVTPRGGRAATLRIRRCDAVVERITLALSPHREDIRFSAFQRVDNMLFPFRIVNDFGDEPESGTVEVARYDVSRRPAASAFARPRSIDDVSFSAGTIAATTIPAHIDAMSNFLIVEASLEGSAPAPFILDTGGHDIVTPREARRLKLTLAGAGTTYGAGSGSSPIRSTRVRSVALGGARLGPQPFAVLDLDLGRTRVAPGREVPIAGILGLEIFERFAVTIERNTVTFSREVDAHACRSIPLRFTSDMPLATARVDGFAGTFGIDTGNNVEPIVFARFLLAHRLRARATRDTTAVGSSVGGAPTLMLGRIATLQLGSMLFKDLTVEISSMKTGSLSTRSEAGNLGLSLIRKLGRITFDYRKHRMCVEPHA